MQLRQVSKLEWIVGGIAALSLAGLVVAEPTILEAPFENAFTVSFTLGAAALGCVAFAVMVHRRVRPGLRVVVLAVPFAAGSFWLLSPFFIDERASDEFVTSLAAAEIDVAARPSTTPPSTTGPPEIGGSVPASPDLDGSVPASPPAVDGPSVDAPPPSPPSIEGPAPVGQPSPPTTVPPVQERPTGPRLLGAGDLTGLAGHEGTGRAGFFELADGSLVLRLEKFDIQNGPDLRLYVIPGAGETIPTPTSLYLGTLRGNVGDQTYELPDESITTGDWTVLVWCEAFRIEFVGGTVSVVS